jgi:hypothetical protein
MSSFDQFPDRPDVSAINEQASTELTDLSLEMRKEILSFVHKAFVTFLQKDRETIAEADRGLLPDQSVQYTYVTEDFLAVPGEMGTEQLALSLKLKPPLKDSEGLEIIGPKPMFMYVPVPHEFSYETDPLPFTEDAYIEQVSRDEEKIRYVIKPHSVSAYSTKSDGQEVTEYDLVAESDVTKRIDSGLPILAKIYENLVNMDIVPQRGFIVGQRIVFNVE